MTLVMSTLPDLSTTAARRQFHDRARAENAIVFGATRAASSAEGEGPLSLRTILNGREEVFLARSRLVLDEDVFLVVNPGTTHATRIRAERDVFCFVVYFCDALVTEVCGWQLTGPDRLHSPLERRIDTAERFVEHLRPHDRFVSPVLRYLMMMSRDRTCEELWYEEQLHFLLERLLSSHEAERASITHLRAVRSRTRHEIYRRITRATDFILSNYDAPLELKSMADVACLEKHHFLKLFTMVHGLTPFEFLRRKRLAVALRLLRQTTWSHGEIARHAGLGTRHTLLRALKEFTGSSPQDYKRAAALAPSGWHSELGKLLEFRRVDVTERWLGDGATAHGAIVASAL